MTESVTNIAEATGTFDSLTTALTSEAVITPLTEELTITKSADKAVWADGYLTYTVTVGNTDTTLPYENVTLTDVLDITKMKLVANSVKINGTATTYTYNDATGLLTVGIGDIAVSSSVVVTFEVEKV